MEGWFACCSCDTECKTELNSLNDWSCMSEKDSGPPAQAASLSHDEFAGGHIAAAIPRVVSRGTGQKILESNHRNGSAKAPQPETDSAKHRLQQVIWTYAQDAVGPGFEVEAAVSMSRHVAAEQAAVIKPLGRMKLRMDARLSCVELWPCDDAKAAATPSLSVALSGVDTVSKAEKAAAKADDQPMLFGMSIVQADGPSLLLSFESQDVRDRSHACIRVLWKSLHRELT
eukprot:gnl/TRDRNA2_/TRDRNA2_62591_c0_seq1.p1 gnl/TRDRNA2_/TRDRNA2_62591_c0~~gnl/TRDRNA2_/TRDRNA2_62591_c0_seq1.p1  ORF type:complete len:229 (-),score=41.17 gnl/TRDRNA2_/TRDRNA2_62591_c0_seq1:82-768(-)